ncbi:septation protein SepH [Parafrigoribacterium mesophilum]|uniref:septation protein SepH n=1 Tax=Parafrigoribacterium mesophilum TaxID=433646 RepID=UPI0031FE1BDD
MQDLKVVSVEHDALLVAADDGERYRIAIDDVLQSKLRRTATRPAPGPKVSPREIQTQIRAGLSASEVAAATGAPLEYIQRFEGPVLAERDYIVNSALGVPVHTAMDVDPITEAVTFGTAIRERLSALGASNESWTSWKDANGSWMVKLSFVSRDIDHDARWSFEPKKAALAPVNGEAVTLSQQGDITGAFLPRLRAVGSESRAADSSRFDSGAFSDEELRQPDRQPEHAHDQPDDGPAFAPGAIHRAVEQKPASSQTADLLEALRRRRGEREAAAFSDDDDPILPGSGGMHLVGTPLPAFDEADDGLFPTAPQPLTAHPRASRKGRVTMPSWDEIVFGARPEDDPA